MDYDELNGGSKAEVKKIRALIAKDARKARRRGSRKNPALKKKR